eukprot:scaffold12494_cov55-Cyclotella_meneghiniana.AAC.1
MRGFSESRQQNTHNISIVRTNDRTNHAVPRRNNNNNPNALSDIETAFANADDAFTAAADATQQTDANNGDPPTTTAIATQPRPSPPSLSCYAV